MQEKQNTIAKEQEVQENIKELEKGQESEGKEKGIVYGYAYPITSASAGLAVTILFNLCPYLVRNGL